MPQVWLLQLFPFFAFNTFFWCFVHLLFVHFLIFMCCTCVFVICLFPFFLSSCFFLFVFSLLSIFPIFSLFHFFIFIRSSCVFSQSVLFLASPQSSAPNHIIALLPSLINLVYFLMPRTIHPFENANAFHCNPLIQHAFGIIPKMPSILPRDVSLGADTARVRVPDAHAALTRV